MGKCREFKRMYTYVHRLTFECSSSYVGVNKNSPAGLLIWDSLVLSCHEALIIPTGLYTVTCHVQTKLGALLKIN